MRHTFSHYHLDIHLVRLRATGNNSDDAATVRNNSSSTATGFIADSNRYLWYPLDHSTQVGLPAPIKKLINTLATEHAAEQSLPP